MIDVLKKITQLREARKWTIYRLADRAGLTPQTIHAWYKKDSLPSIPTLESICTAFSITMSDFFAEGNVDYTIEVTPQIKTMHDVWLTLAGKDRELVVSIVKRLGERKEK